jgi:hypothetical protein
MPVLIKYKTKKEKYKRKKELRQDQTDYFYFKF